MINKEKHQLIMSQILKDIYGDIKINSLLGFKGGTCAYFFYNLSRFSVDLDFDLLVVSEENKEIIFKKIISILGKYGILKDKYIKRDTIFALLSYGNDDHNIKIEINCRELIKDIKNHYEVKEYIGISMLVANKEYLFTSKLLALTSRNKLATRDVYDIYYFSKNNWDINIDIIKQRTSKEIKEYLNDCILFIEKRKDNQILQGLGEFIEDEKEKRWIKNNLKKESIFMLRNYLSILKK